MKYLKFYVVICFCVFFGLSCGSNRSNGYSPSGEGEYEKTETKECEYCNGKGVRMIPCSNCNGTGKTDSYYYEERTERIPCSSCGGIGFFNCAKCNGTDRRNCEECFGRGVRTCDICKGNGVISLPYVGNTECTHCGGGGLIKCFACNGNGIVKCGYCSEGKVMCKDCWGNGYHNAPTNESGTRNTICDNCNGSKYFEEKCQECDGEGEITVVKVYDSKTNSLIREERK
jgi:hypothetical protein